MMLKLYQFPSLWELPNASPFCMKLETYLRMAKIPFEAVTVFNPRKNPKGKLPCICVDGKKIADSGLIIDYLQQKYGDTLDHHLTQEQKAAALPLRRMLEEHLYWIMVYSRWLDERYWKISEDVFFAHLKGPLRYFIPKLVRRKLCSDLRQQGIGRHSTTEIYQLGIDDLQALSVFLAQHPFCMGNEPSSVDACVYAFLANILQPPIPSPLQDYAKSQKQFLAYCERMQQRFYS